MTSTFTYDPNNWEDPVMQELHWLRAERAKEFNYDVVALLKDSAAHGQVIRKELECRKKVINQNPVDIEKRNISSKSSHETGYLSSDTEYQTLPLASQ